jgi:hypothetical protein
MSDLTNTGLVFSSDGGLVARIHRENGLDFSPFLPPQGGALVIVPKNAYDLCVTEADILRLALLELTVSQPDIAVLVEQKITAIDASTLNTESAPSL